MFEPGRPALRPQVLVRTPPPSCSGARSSTKRGEVVRAVRVHRRDGQREDRPREIVETVVGVGARGHTGCGKRARRRRIEGTRAGTVGKVPPGFTKIVRGYPGSCRKPNPVAHIVIPTGLVAISIFVEAVRSRRPQVGPTQTASGLAQYTSRQRRPARHGSRRAPAMMTGQIAQSVARRQTGSSSSHRFAAPRGRIQCDRISSSAAAGAIPGARADHRLRAACRGAGTRQPRAGLPTSPTSTTGTGRRWCRSTSPRGTHPQRACRTSPGTIRSANFPPLRPGAAAPCARGAPSAAQSVGSNFIIGSGGYVITNAHVVDSGRTRSRCACPTREFRQRSIGADKRTDVGCSRSTPGPARR